MTYGPNTPDVQVVIDFLYSGRLLSQRNPPTEENITIIRDLADVERFRESPASVPDEESWSWVDIKLSAGTGSRVIGSKVWKQLGHDLCERFDEIWDVWAIVVRKQLGGSYEEQEVQEILGDLEWISQYRAAFGRTNPFIERFFEMYRLGGYPCGWDGAYPAGRLVVYFPPVESTPAEARIRD